ncbi:MAG: hypothetical protein KGJ74_11320 [Betaproteobacteria bacterium]|nr:hypothetical protein [Betaproteobacteria bacterium]
MTKRGKPNEKPESGGRIEVPSEPINPELLPGNVDHAEAERMISGLTPKWVEAPDLCQFSAYIQDLVNLAEHGDSWRADQVVRHHPRAGKRSLLDDLRAIADAQIRQYAMACKKNRVPIDSAACAYLARQLEPLRRSRGRKVSEQTGYETLKLAAWVKNRMNGGLTFEQACEPDNPNEPGDSRAAKAYSALKDTPEIELMATLLRAGADIF